MIIFGKGFASGFYDFYFHKRGIFFCELPIFDMQTLNAARPYASRLAEVWCLRSPSAHDCAGSGLGGLFSKGIEKTEATLEHAEKIEYAGHSGQIRSK